MQQHSFRLAVPLAYLSSALPRIIGGADAAVGNIPGSFEEMPSEKVTMERFSPSEPTGVVVTHYRWNDEEERRLSDSWHVGRVYEAGLQHSGGIDPGELEASLVHSIDLHELGPGLLHTGEIDLYELAPGLTLVEAWWSDDLDAYFTALFAAWRELYPGVPPLDGAADTNVSAPTQPDILDCIPSARDREIVRLLRAGRTDPEIARTIGGGNFVSKTVTNRLSVLRATYPTDVVPYRRLTAATRKKVRQ